LRDGRRSIAANVPVLFLVALEGDLVNTPSSIAEDSPTTPTTSQGPETTAAAQEAHGTPADAGRPAEDKLRTYREAFLLNQLLQALPDHKMEMGLANRKMGVPAKKHLGLTAEVANRLRDELAARQYLRIEKTGQRVSFELTDEGREYLQTLEQYPFPSRKAGAGTIPENLREYVKPYLLLRLLLAGESPIPLGQANRFDTLGKTHLRLTPRAARPFWDEMASEGLVRAEPRQRTVLYELTPAGRTYLASHDHYPHFDYKLRGTVLNELLHGHTAARGQESAQEAPPKALFTPRPADLSEAAWAEFEELRREQYGHTGLVPIHQVRQRIAEKYGPETARHDVLDEPILQLGRDGRVRLIALSDLQKATADQLNASIPGVNETLFYLERAYG
jgi:DNA-binding PadR family transcriptional regulator